MRYLGGKNRIRKKICEVLKQLRVKKQPYFEPFVGGGAVLFDILSKYYSKKSTYGCFRSCSTAGTRYGNVEHISDSKYCP